MRHATSHPAPITVRLLMLPERAFTSLLISGTIA